MRHAATGTADKPLAGRLPQLLPELPINLSVSPTPFPLSEGIDPHEEIFVCITPFLNAGHSKQGYPLHWERTGSYDMNKVFKVGPFKQEPPPPSTSYHIIHSCCSRRIWCSGTSESKKSRKTRWRS